MPDRIYFEPESLNEDWQREAAHQRVLDIIAKAMEGPGVVKIGTLRLLGDPDKTFTVSESDNAITVGLLEGEALGDPVFLFDKKENKVKLYEPGPWELRLAAL